MHAAQNITVALDARPLIVPGNGNARYLEQMLASLFLIRPAWKWVLFSHKKLHPDYAELLSHHQLRLITGSRLPGPLWIHLTLPSLLQNYKHDVFWGTLAMLPLGYGRRAEAPAAVNFHDLNAFVAPESMVRWNAWQHRLTNERTLREARTILCLSGATAQDIRRVFPESRNKRMVVVYPGAEMRSESPQRPPPPVGNLRDFIFCVGTLEPRKNQITLVSAYLKARGTVDLPPLLLAGKKGWGNDDLYQKLSTGVYSERQIYFLEQPDDGQLAWCYDQAAFVAQPSLHEGFGLPILEAMHHKKVLLLSDIAVFREVGQGNVFIPPLDVDAWARNLADFSVLSRTGQLRPRALDPLYWSWKKRAEILAQALEITASPQPGSLSGGWQQRRNQNQGVP